MRDLVSALRLIRLPNTLTAFADVMAGAAVAGVDPLSPRVLLAGVGSAALYGGGIALNDVLDIEKDRRSSPDRVLPSGALAKTTAGVIAAALLLVGVATGLTGELPHILVTVALVATIIVYDTLPEGRRLLGSLVMGSCRALNIARSMTLATTSMAQPEEWIVACTHCGLILLVTLVSTFESRPRRDLTYKLVVAAMLLPYLVPALTADAALFPYMLAVGVALGSWVTLPGWAGDGRPIAVVKRAIFTLVLFDALYAAAAGRHEAAAVMVGLLPAIYLLAKALGQKGS